MKETPGVAEIIAMILIGGGILANVVIYGMCAHVQTKINSVKAKKQSVKRWLK